MDNTLAFIDPTVGGGTAKLVMAQVLGPCPVKPSA